MNIVICYSVDNSDYRFIDYSILYYIYKIVYSNNHLLIKIYYKLFNIWITYIYIYIYTHIYTHTHTHTHTNIYIYIYKPIVNNIFQIDS